MSTNASAKGARSASNTAGAAAQAAEVLPVVGQARDAADAATATLAEDVEPAEVGVEIEHAEALAEQAAAGDIDLAAGEDDDEDSEDSLTFSNGVIEKIVALAMRDVPGVVGMKGSWFNRVQDAFGASDSTKGVSVEVTPESAVRVNISVFIEYGSYAPQVFEDVKKAVVKQVTGMTGLEVAGVNLRIEDVLTEEEFDRSKKGEEGSEA